MEKKQKKRKEHKLTAQCIGIVLVVFALGLFVGYSCDYQDTIANFFTDQSTDRTHMIHGSSELSEHGARVGYYILGTTETDRYIINFEKKIKQSVGRSYAIDGTFTNNTDDHFVTVELNFSLLDKNGNKIGDAYAYCDGLNPDQTWRFCAENLKPIEVDSVVVSAVLDDVIYMIL